jgi:hypothetical protein
MTPYDDESFRLLLRLFIVLFLPIVSVVGHDKPSKAARS